MKLQENEGIVEDIQIYKDCIGTEKTNTDIMVTFVKKDEGFEYFDVFFTKEKAIELRDKLTHFIEKE